VVQSYRGLRAAGKYGTVGLELVLSMAVGYLLGRWVDGKWFGGRGWGTFVGSALGVYAGFRALWLTAKRLEAETERAVREEREEQEENAALEAFRARKGSAETEKEAP
jgi:F0F1-type ATP synthase assembly protein I